MARDILYVRHRTIEAGRVPDSKVIGAWRNRIRGFERIALVNGIEEQLAQGGCSIAQRSLDEEVHL